MKQTSSKRNMTLDGARGLALTLMTLNHFLLLITPLSGALEYTGDALGFFSMAEVFFFLAGFSVFLAYFDNSSPHFDSAARHRTLLKRVGVLCLAEAVMIIGFYAVTGRSPLNLSALSSADYSRTPLFPLGLDILPVHIVILSFIAVFYIKLSRMRVRTLIIVSIAIWLVGWASASLLRLSSPDHPIFYLLYFNPFATQLLYTLGFTLACSIKEKQFQSARDRLLSPLFGLGFLMVAGCFGAFRHLSLVDLTPLSVLISRQDFGPLRLFNFVIILGLILWLSARFPLDRLIKPFNLLGHYCLWIFVCSTVGLYALQSFLMTSSGQSAVSGPTPVTTIQIFATCTLGFLVVRDLD